MDDKQLQKLIRQNAAKAKQAQEAAKQRSSRRYDATLPPTSDDDADRENQRFFKEMKRREF